MKLSQLLAAIAIIALPAISRAEPNECVAGLIPNVTISASSQHLNMAVLKIIDEETYRELRKGGSGSAKFPIKGVPIEASGNYQEWDTKRRTYLEVNKFDLSYDEAFLLFRREIPEVAYAAYKECLVRGSNAPGVHIIVDDYNDKTAFVTIRWSPPPTGAGTLGPTTVTVEAVGTTPEMSKLLPITLGAGHSRPLTFPLVAGTPFVVTASTADGYSARRKLDVSPDKLKIPDVPEEKQIVIKDLLIKALDEGKVCVVRLGEHDWSNKPGAYVGAPRATSAIDNLYEVRYESDTETWRSHGRNDDAYPSLGVHRGPSLAKQQINIYNQLYTLGEDGSLITAGRGLGRLGFKTGRLFCPIATSDLR